MDEYGAPPYPELVLVVRRESLHQIGEQLADLLGVLRDGTRTALADRDAAVEDLVDASGADEPLVRAQLDAVAPALRPPLRLDRKALAEWAEFDARFGILERPPRVRQAFRPRYQDP